uniref:Uncharacterized protein n=1 Tax=Aegilops tauschii subsp. strangulata TaxID=200361 RepID=A0A453DIX0_AEGTS
PQWVVWVGGAALPISASSSKLFPICCCCIPAASLCRDTIRIAFPLYTSSRPSTSFSLFARSRPFPSPLSVLMNPQHI